MGVDWVAVGEPLLEQLSVLQDPLLFVYPPFSFASLLGSLVTRLPGMSNSVSLLSSLLLGVAAADKARDDRISGELLVLFGQ